MAYARYSRDCEWYIYWVMEEASCREDERLAIWHAGRSDRHEISYPAAKEMLRRSDYRAIPGREVHDDALLRRVLSAFLDDVDRQWMRARRLP